MAITINQEPTSPNVSYTKLLYVVSGSDQSYEQYKYVVDIYENGESERFARLKTVTNPEGVGIIEISAAIQDQLNYDLNWDATGSYINLSSSKDFILKFGEEYASSSSGSVTVYDGEGNPGDPVVTSSVLNIFKGTVDPTINNSYNFDQDPFDTGSMASDEDRGPRLSDSPFGYSQTADIISLSTSDSHTISVLGELDSGYRYFGLSCSFASGSWVVYTVDLYYTGSGGQITSSYYFGNDEYNLGDLITPIPLSSYTSIAGPLTCRVKLAGFGDVNSAMAVGGLFSGSFPIQSGSESWNGTSWTLENNMTYARAEFDGCGVSSAAGLVNGGSGDGPPALQDETYTAEEWNGSTWSLVNNMTNPRLNHVTIGTPSAAITCGGQFGSPGGTANELTTGSETWNGTNWSIGPSLPVAKWKFAGAGNFSNGTFWGSEGTGVLDRNTVFWDGSVFSLGPSIDGFIFYDDNEGDGAANDCVSAGAEGGDISTAYWNGIEWASGTQYPYSWGGGAAAGQTSNTIFFGGYSGSTYGVEYCPPVTAYRANTEAILNFEYQQSPTTYPVCYPPTKFAFINNYGVWDYVQVIFPIQKITDLERENVTLSQTKYGSSLSPYDISRRGITTYYTKPKSKYRITTGYLPQDEADWWPQLIESPSVYVQQDGQFLGIVVNNSSYDWKTNPRGQKIFQYTIEFEYANNDRARL